MFLSPTPCYLSVPCHLSVLSAHLQATKLFVSNLNARLAQRFLALVLLPRIRQEIREKQRLHLALFMAMKKATYKPGAFYKVCPGPPPACPLPRASVRPNPCFKRQLFHATPMKMCHCARTPAQCCASASRACCYPCVRSAHARCARRSSSAHHPICLCLQGLLLPLCASRTCTLREAVIFSAVLKRTSIPVLHSAAALLRMVRLCR